MNLNDLIDKRLEELAPKGDDLCSQAVRYALLGGGKRFRPKLTLSTVTALGGNIKDALTPACAIEMVHAYSMIHDDLPCMDNDDFRRGKPTVHRAFSEGIAVLAGDYLLTHAFEVIANAPYLDAEKKLLLIQILTLKSGGKGMIHGQVLDIGAEGKKISLKELEELHLLKTGALITASVEFGSVIATGSVDDNLSLFAKYLGLAFQINDDILDITKGKEKHGRASDIANDKATYVSLLGLDGAKNAAELALEKAKNLAGDKLAALLL